MQDVEAVVEELADRDEAGLVVAACWYDVSDERPNYLMSQFDVQNFLWLTLPQLLRQPPADLDPMPDWHAVVAEAAWFFDRLDQPRYAAICRGEQTRRILEAAGDPLRSFELYAQATHESGIMPPPGLRITWLDEPGPHEQALYDAITRALERAIAAGDLDPVDDGKRLALATGVLEQLPDGHTETLLDLMLVERMERLRGTCGSQTIRELLVRVGPDVSKPLDLSPEILLAGTRPLAQVVHASDGSGPLCAVAEKFGLLERVDGEWHRTDEGDRVLTHPVVLFEAILTGFAQPKDPVANLAALPVLAMLILADTIDVDMLLDRLGMVFAEADEGESVSAASIRSAVDEMIADMNAVGLAVDGHRLTPFGRRVALAGVRARAMLGATV